MLPSRSRRNASPITEARPRSSSTSPGASSTTQAAITEGQDAPPGESYFAAENPKGELGFYFRSKGGGYPDRMYIRAPSFSNLQILPATMEGHYLPDTVAILGSFDFVMGECDR